MSAQTPVIKKQLTSIKHLVTYFQSHIEVKHYGFFLIPENIYVERLKSAEIKFNSTFAFDHSHLLNTQ